MKIYYDEKSDAIYVRFSDDKIVESEEKEKDVVIDYNEKEEVVAVEVLNVRSTPHTIDLPIVLKDAS